MSDDGREYGPAEIETAYEEALDDVHTRFVLNLPPEELSSTDRIFFQLEQGWWFYDDFICDHSDIPLPRFKGVKPFALKMFEISPLLSPMLPQFNKLWEEFSKYKRTISTYGTILMNADCTKVILCQVWNGKTWMFPAGKVNQNEHGCDAGARETYEETGFDPNCTLGLTKDMLASGEGIPWKTPLDPNDGLVFIDSGKRRTLYVCRGVPEDFPFEPVARKEVSAVEWHDLDSLPKKSFAVFPFLSQLKRWIRQNTGKKKKSKSSQSTPKRRPKSTTPNKQRRSESARKPRSRNNSRGKVRENDLSAQTGLAAAGEEDGWDEDAMFSANEKILGRKITYDGNPHQFAEKGFDGGLDPHAFHVVGGSFMNSGIAKLAPAPEQSKLQPLFRKEEDTQDGLEPFFSDGGETPWGQAVSEARSTDSTPKRQRPKNKKKEKSDSPEDAGQELLKILQKKVDSDAATESKLASTEGLDALFLTDKDITARSQKAKTSSQTEPIGPTTSMSHRCKEPTTANPLQEWADSLPKVPATATFGDFRFDKDAIVKAMNDTLQVSNS